MILVIDVGTSSVRGLLFDHNAVVKRKIQKKYPLHISGEKGVLQDVELVLNSVLDILGQMRDWAQKNGDVIDGMSVTAQRSSVIPVSKEGVALDWAMSWQDKRAVTICEEFSSQKEYIYHITGMGLSPVFSAPKMLYMKRDDRQLYDDAEKLIGFQEYIIYHLTGEFVSDTSIASRTGLFNISECEWSKELLELYGVGEDKLCRLIPVGSIAGYTTKEITRLLGNSKSIPVISAGGDQQCAALGLGCINAGELEVNSGTGAYVIGIANQPIFHPSMGVNCNVSAIQGKWIVEGSVLAAGKALDWIKRELFPEKKGEKEFFNECETVPPGANGVIVSPSFAGKATPKWNAGIRAGIFNLDLSHTRYEIARATMEGIAAELLECVNTIEGLMGMSGNTIKAAGGLMLNPVYREILCNMLGKTIYQPEMCEATGLGAWISAEVALGNYHSYEEAFLRCQGAEKVMVQTPDMEINSLYRSANKLREMYEEIYTNI